MQIQVRDCGQCIVKSWSSAFTRGLTCVIDHPSQSSFASVMSRLHRLQNSSLLKREKCQCTGSSLTKPCPPWKENRQWMWRQWQPSDGIQKDLDSQDFALLWLISQTEGAGEQWLQRIHTPTFVPQALAGWKADSFINPALNREVWVLFLCPFFPGFVFWILGENTNADLAFINKKYSNKAVSKGWWFSVVWSENGGSWQSFETVIPFRDALEENYYELASDD